jgi:hypothetical protein
MTNLEKKLFLKFEMIFCFEIWKENWSYHHMKMKFFEFSFLKFEMKFCTLKFEKNRPYH